MSPNNSTNALPPAVASAPASISAADPRPDPGRGRAAGRIRIGLGFPLPLGRVLATRAAAIAIALALAPLATPAFVLAFQEGDANTADAKRQVTDSSGATVVEGHSYHGEAFNDGPRQRARLMAGQGRVDFPVTTRSPEAALFVEQGVAQLHTFFYFEAERSFREAAALDPDCAMAYWGMAMANANNEKRAKAFLEEAAKPERFDRITPREKLHIEALRAKYNDKFDAKRRLREHVLKLETIVQDHPGDLDAKAWLAMTLWENAGKGIEINSRQAVDSLIGEVLRAHPTHPGAHHYRIHLWDRVKPERALSSAPRYAEAAPGIAHAWHMPGHTYWGLKRYGDAAYQQEGSARADHAYMIRDGVMPFQIHNYAHNNEWLVRSLNNLGQVRKAVAVARNLVEQPRDPKLNNPRQGDSAQRYGRQRWMETLARFELWAELARAIDSGELDFSDEPDERLNRLHALGLARAHLARAARDSESASASETALAKLDECLTDLREDIAIADETERRRKAREEAEKARAEAEKARAAAEKTGTGTETETEPAKPAETPTPAPADSNPNPNPGPETEPATPAKPESDDPKPAETPKPATPDDEWKPPRRVAAKGQLERVLNELEALRALAVGDLERAGEAFANVSTLFPEAKARGLRDAGKLEEALKAARDAVERNPNQVSPLAALVEILAAAGPEREADARAAYAKLRAVAAEADPDLPASRRIAEIARARGWADVQPDPDALAATTGPHAPFRIPLDSVGPLLWSPSPAPDFALPDTDGRAWTLAARKGRPVVLLFYLGGGCAHCMEQLKAFAAQHQALLALGADVAAVSTDDELKTRELKHNPDEVDFPMTLLSDPKLEVFRAWRVFDEFEDQPLHGTFLIDRDGVVRYAKVSADPFMDVEFLKAELARAERLAGTRAGAVAESAPNPAPANAPAAGR